MFIRTLDDISPNELFGLMAYVDLYERLSREYGSSSGSDHAMVALVLASHSRFTSYGTWTPRVREIVFWWVKTYNGWDGEYCNFGCSGLSLEFLLKLYNHVRSLLPSGGRISKNDDIRRVQENTAAIIESDLCHFS